MTIQPIEFKGSAVLDATLEAAAGRDASLVMADSTLLDLRERIAGLALRHRLSTFSSIPEFTRRRVGWVRPLPTGQLPTCRDLREEGA
jgi:hypothetical protein